MKIKRLNTFQEYLKEQKQQKLNESNVSIEVDWWDQCIVEVLQDLEDECNGFLSWTTLGNFIKSKFSILGRSFDEYIDNIYILHIKDLIFTHHGKSFCDAEMTDNAVLHTKGVVVENLAQVIYDKLCEKLGDGDESNSSTVKVVDPEPTAIVAVKTNPVTPDEDDDLCDALQFESRNVKTYKDFLKEAVATKVKPEDSNFCVNYCLDRIKKDAGSLDTDAIFDAAVKCADGRAKTRLIAMYVRPMVEDCLNDKNVVICNLEDTDDEQKQDQLIGDALDAFIDRMTDDVLYAIYKVNGGLDEKDE